MDEGQIIIDGEKTEITNPDDALRKGLAMVHQELQPIPDRSIAENMYLGRYPMKSVGPLKMVDHKTMNSAFTPGKLLLTPFISSLYCSAIPLLLSIPSHPIFKENMLPEGIEKASQELKGVTGWQSSTDWK